MSEPIREREVVALTRGNRQALDQIEEAIGGRNSAIEILGLAPLDKKQEHFLRLLCDPIREHDSIAVITRDAGLLPSQVIQLFREASFAKAHALSMTQLAERIPDIVQDLTKRSTDAVVTCPDCMGEGSESEIEPCARCHGRGLVIREGDLDHKKVALELGGLLKKGTGVNVNVQQNNISASAPGAFFSRFVKASDKDAYDVAVIDAEVKE